ncbi:MAG: protease pro-enzyme activation domain-containing protein [Actinomycetota bacterium]|nr:protease pro-enzyme activation domain-containing protein [Actinomycetota bacterium]
MPLALALASVTALLVGGVAPVPATATAATPARVLWSNVLFGLDQLPSSVPDPATPMQVGVALSRPDPAGEVAFYQRLYQPASGDYRQFLTPDQFNQRFGVAAPAYQQTVTWLQGAGLSVDTSVVSRDYLLATGTVAQI